MKAQKIPDLTEKVVEQVKMRYDSRGEGITNMEVEYFQELLRGIQVFPITSNLPYIYPIQSLSRNSHFRKIAGHNIIIHDKKLVDTLVWLYSIKITKERPLFMFIYVLLVFNELLLNENRGDLALYFNYKTKEFINSFRNNGKLERPLFIKGSLDDSIDVIQEQLNYQSASIKNVKYAFEQMVILHEIGHHCYNNSNEWKKTFDEFYEKIPFDQKFSAIADFNRNFKMNQLSEEQKEKANQKLSENLREEIASDYLAIMTLLMNTGEDYLHWPPETVLGVYIGFMIESDALSNIRYQMELSRDDRIRFSTAYTNLMDRIKAIIFILENVNHFIPSTFEAKLKDKIVKSVSSKALEILQRLQDDIYATNQLYSFMLQLPAPFEMKYNIAKTTIESINVFFGETVEKTLQRQKELFSEDYLAALNHRSDPFYARAPYTRALCQALAYTRLWTIQYHGDKQIVDEQRKLSKALNEAEILKELSSTFTEIRDPQNRIMQLL